MAAKAYVTVATAVTRLSASPDRSSLDIVSHFTTPEEAILAGIKKEPAKAEEPKEKEADSKPAKSSHWR